MYLYRHAYNCLLWKYSFYLDVQVVMSFGGLFFILVVPTTHAYAKFQYDCMYNISTYYSYYNNKK